MKTLDQLIEQARHSKAPAKKCGCAPGLDGRECAADQKRWGLIPPEASPWCDCYCDHRANRLRSVGP